MGEGLGDDGANVVTRDPDAVEADMVEQRQQIPGVHFRPDLIGRTLVELRAVAEAA